jgi:hypothetical protein
VGRRLVAGEASPAPDRMSAGRSRRGPQAVCGQQVPVVVVALSEEPGRYRLIDGFRRLRALVRLGCDTVWELGAAGAGSLAVEPESADRLDDGGLLPEGP